MSTIYLRSRSTEIIRVRILNELTREWLTGATTVKVSIMRASDDMQLDWSDATFKASGWTTRQATMSEVDAANAPGVYKQTFDTSAITNPIADDVYLVTVEQVGAPIIQFSPLLGEIRMGGFVDMLDVAVSSRAAPGDEMSLPMSIINQIQTVDVDAVAFAVWNTPDGAGTMGRALSALRRRETNRRKINSSGLVTFYGDDGATAEKTVQLLDVNGNAVVIQPGDPAESSAEGYP